MQALKALSACLIVAVSIACSSTSCAAPQTGWWWNSVESGRGVFIESHDGIIFLAGYFYETDGRPVWLAAGGPNADPYSYTGLLQRFSGGQTLFGGYQTPAAPTDA